ncbi:MAG: hypothetical protein D6771_04675 [Zetaproteobacteria bacterium]|nr:MAG: hypothetical protein D6771_04675 [Zetaproteobacteria bacterium]
MGKWRIVVRIETDRILVLRIAHRGEVYKR